MAIFNSFLYVYQRVLSGMLLQVADPWTQQRNAQLKICEFWCLITHTCAKLPS